MWAHFFDLVVCSFFISTALFTPLIADVDWTTLLPMALGSGGAGASVTFLLRYILAKKKFAVITHEDLLNRLEKSVTSLEAAHDRCMKEHAAAQRELAGLQETVARIEGTRLVATVVSNDQGTIVEWSSAATALFHYSSEEAMGKNVALLTPTRYRRAHILAFKRAVQERRGPLHNNPMRLYALTREGIEVPVLVTLEGWEIDGKLFYAAEFRRCYEFDFPTFNRSAEHSHAQEKPSV